ncbi:MAG: ABC transporter permease [Leucobacter sp.]|nr:ABC transporter permease [Leucobacter sp.]
MISTTGTSGTSALWRRYRWVLFRLVAGIGTLFLVAVVVFFATSILPGDVARVILGRLATDEAVAALRESMGLNDPLVVQFGRWLGGLLGGDPGASLISGVPVLDYVIPRLANTLILVAFVAVIGIPLAIVLGVSAALRPRSVADWVVNTASIVIAGLPEFVIGILLIVLFSTGILHLLPAVSITPTGNPIADPVVLVLPVATLVIVILPYTGRQMRASMLDVLGTEYIEMARLRGLRESRVVWNHAIRNGLAPAIQAAGLTLAFLLGGTIVVEYLFQYPGIGMALNDAVMQRDMPVVQFVVVIMASGYILFNLLADVLTVLVTPKLRTAQ